MKKASAAAGAFFIQHGGHERELQPVAVSEAEALIAVADKACAIFGLSGTIAGGYKHRHRPAPDRWATALESHDLEAVGRQARALSGTKVWKHHKLSGC